MRVVSLLPAATEIVAALGCVDTLVGISHECDFPPEVATRPRVTHCAIHGNALPSDETDRWVREQLAQHGTLYTLDTARVRELAPDVIVTQELCDVCAVDYSSVAAFAATLPGPPTVVSLAPQRLADVLADVARVAAALDVPARGAEVIAGLEARIDAVARRVGDAPRRRCVLLEWTLPPFRGGHWSPELVALAGGFDPLGRPGEDAAPIAWEDVVQAAPDVLVLACCGYDVARTLADVAQLAALPGWAQLPAVRAGEVWAVDGKVYFSRPGPRLADSLELLAAVLHPDRFVRRFAPDACQLAV